MDVLYLDFDGTTHPGEVWYERATQQVSMRAPGHELFESLPIFEEIIAPFPSIRIVISSSWVQALGFEKTRAFLPETLQRRVIGATYDPQSSAAWRWSRLTRYDTIALDVRSRKPDRWLALDDDAVGWPQKEHAALVLVPTELGLSCPDAQARLRARLAARFP